MAWGEIYLQRQHRTSESIQETKPLKCLVQTRARDALGHNRFAEICEWGFAAHCVEVSFCEQKIPTVIEAGFQRILRNTGNGTFDLTLRPDAGPCAVFEELIHLGQHRTGRFAQWESQHGTAGATAFAESDAATRLVRNQIQYGISDAEHAINLQRVQDFLSDLDRLRIPYD